MEELSKHDLDITQQIIDLKKKHGWSFWAEIKRLAKKLKNEREKKMWLDLCKRHELQEKIKH